MAGHVDRDDSYCFLDRRLHPPTLLKVARLCLSRVAALVFGASVGWREEAGRYGAQSLGSQISQIIKSQVEQSGGREKPKLQT